jgi:hypothetical protein
MKTSTAISLCDNRRIEADRLALSSIKYADYFGTVKLIHFRPYRDIAGGWLRWHADPTRPLLPTSER